MSREKNFLDTTEISISNQKNSLFELLVNDDKSYEVEIRLSSKKLHKHTCECPIFQKTKVCAHISACYLYLRKQLLQHQDQSVKVKRSSGIKRKSIREMIEQVQQEDLVSFLQSYAKKDKKLSTAIRVHFLSQNKIIKS